MLWWSSQLVGVGSAARPTEIVCSMLRTACLRHCRKSKAFDAYRCPITHVLFALRLAPSSTDWLPALPEIKSLRCVPLPDHTCSARLTTRSIFDSLAPGTAGRKERTIVRSFLRFCTSKRLYKNLNILYNHFVWQRFQFATYDKTTGKGTV